MKRAILGMVTVVALSAVLFACNQGTSMPQTAGEAKPSGTVASGPAPKLSGKLTVYTSIQPEPLDKIKEAVKKALPGVEVGWFQASTEPLIAKIDAEMQAGKVAADVLMVADPSYYVFLKSRGILHTYKSPNAAGAMGIQDPDGYYTSVRVINAVIGYNTRLVKKEDAPRKFVDLTGPSWKGKVGIPDATQSGSAFDTVAALSGKYGWEYYRGLKSNQAVIADGQGALEKKLVSGEVAVATILEMNILMSKAKGEPIELVYPEDGVGVFPSPIGIIKTTANPDAARAMIDWWFTKEGQQSITEGFMHSVRKDVAPPAGAVPLSDFVGRALPIDWDKLSKDIPGLKDKFTAIMRD